MDTLLQQNPDSLSVKDLEKLIIYLNKEYRFGTEVVDDETFDEYVDMLKEKNPKSSVLEKIGAPVRDDLVKVKLPFWMGSMNKVKPNSKELERWLRKYNGPYFCSAKLDGLSCLYGNDQLFTRGDGNVGQDISYLIPYLDLPELEEDVYVRGELIIKKDIFDKYYSKQFPKARSVVAGVINSKKPDSKILKHIDFVAFELIDDQESSPSEQFDWLEENDFKIPEISALDSDFDTEQLTPLLQHMKRMSPYEIDGIIIADDHFHPRNTSDNPKYAVAYKVNAKGKKTTIKQVLWEPSMHGIIKPRINFETVLIDGDEVSFATAFNAKYVKDNGLRSGIEVKIVKSGDVIPYIAEIIYQKGSRARPEMPDKKILGDYHWNENEIELELVDPLQNPIVRRKRLVHFFKSLGIKFISDGVVKKFIKAGIKTPKQIYDSSVDQFLELDGVKQKSAEKYFNAIHQVLDHPIPIQKVMKASLALGKGFGERKLLPLVSEIEIVTGTKGKYRFRKPDLKSVLEIEGFSHKTAGEFINNFSKFVDWMNDNPYIQLQIPIKDMDEKDLPLGDKFILFTGIRDKTISDRLEKLGAKIEGSFTKKVNILVVKDQGTSNAKTEKARKQGIPVYTIDQVKEKLLG